MSVRYDIPLKIQSSSSNCVQTSTSQFLSFYNLSVSPDQIEKAVPVRTNDEGKPMGTLFADIGAWLQQEHQFQTAMHVFDAQVIDRGWKELSQEKLLGEIEHTRQHGISTARTPYAPLLIDAYISYLKTGGNVAIEKCTNSLLQQLLSKGPVLAIISFNYMYDYPRASFDPSQKTYVPDAVDGKVIEHAVVLTGYEDEHYYYNDPDIEYGGQHKVADDVLIGAICAAQINSDNYLLSVEGNKS